MSEQLAKLSVKKIAPVATGAKGHAYVASYSRPRARTFAPVMSPAGRS